MEENKCMVSILCTAYMHEKFIAQTLDSFLMQETDFPFEILVSDDASTDGTADIIRSYQQRYPDKLRTFLMEENIFSQGRNFYTEFLFPNAKGKYICHCEGDDYWTDKDKLQRQVDFLEAHPEYSACVHNTTLHYCDGSAPDRPLISMSEDIDLSMEAILSGASRSFHTSSLMARREILTDTQDFYHVAYRYGFTDYANNVWLRLNGKVRCLNSCMSVYRINSNTEAWSSGVDFQYGKLCHFIHGQCDMLRTLLPHTEDDTRRLVEQALLEREFEIMYIEGRDREQRRQPYRALLKKKSLSYRIKNFVKSYFPAIQRMHRKKRGWE